MTACFVWVDAGQQGSQATAGVGHPWPRPHSCCGAGDTAGQLEELYGDLVLITQSQPTGPPGSRRKDREALFSFGQDFLFEHSGASGRGGVIALRLDCPRPMEAGHDVLQGSTATFAPLEH